MIEKKTTVKLSDNTRDLLKQAKQQFRYSTMDELIEDSCNYFLNYNQSPKEIKEPIGMLFNKFSDRFFGAFNKTNKEILNPFIKDSYKFYNKVLDNLDSPIISENTEKEIKVFQEEKIVVENTEEKELRKLILELDKQKIPYQENGNNYFKISAVEYNKVLDKIKMM